MALDITCSVASKVCLAHYLASKRHLREDIIVIEIAQNNPLTPKCLRPFSSFVEFGLN